MFGNEVWGQVMNKGERWLIGFGAGLLMYCGGAYLAVEHSIPFMLPLAILGGAVSIPCYVLALRSIN